MNMSYSRKEENVNIKYSLKQFILFERKSIYLMNRAFLSLCGLIHVYVALYIKYWNFWKNKNSNLVVKYDG